MFSAEWGMVFKSNLYPMGLTFRTITGDKYKVNRGDGRGGEERGGEGRGGEGRGGAMRGGEGRGEKGRGGEGRGGEVLSDCSELQAERYFSPFALKKARAVGRNIVNFTLFIKVGNTRSVVLTCVTGVHVT